MAAAEGKKTLLASAKTASSKFSVEDISLVVVEGPHQGKELRVETDLVRIGRDDWCDLVLDKDQWVSNIHCECWIDERGIRIRDLNSKNGVLLDNCPIFDAYLRPGAKVKIGSSIIEVKSHNQTREISISYHDSSGLLVGKSPKIRKIFSMLPKLGVRKVATLLTGETGTGKTTVAQAIHQQSNEKDGPFVVVNCGALPAGLIEAALFGHEKGAFTGADARREGFFEQAHGGTLFLDEIAELPLDLQPKLLDVIERRQIRRLGGTSELPVDFRLITATHRHLPTEIQEGRFREDLYFRVTVVEFEVPPLRERIEDISLLIDKLLLSLSPQSDIKLSEEAMRALKGYLWPGNIRELRNVLERSITFLEGNTIELDDLNLRSLQSNTQSMTNALNAAPQNTQLSSSQSSLLPSFPLSNNEGPLELKAILAEAEKTLLLQALTETDANVQSASKLLSISPAWLYNRIKKYDIKIKK